MDFSFLLGEDLISTIINVVGFIGVINFIGYIFLMIGFMTGARRR